MPLRVASRAIYPGEIKRGGERKDFFLILRNTFSFARSWYNRISLSLMKLILKLQSRTEMVFHALCDCFYAMSTSRSVLSTELCYEFFAEPQEEITNARPDATAIVDQFLLAVPRLSFLFFFPTRNCGVTLVRKSVSHRS